jgi:hypothetical protein
MVQVCATIILYRYLLKFSEIILETLKKCRERNINVKGISASSGTLFSAPRGRPHVAFNNYRLTVFYNKSSVAL